MGRTQLSGRPAGQDRLNDLGLGREAGVAPEGLFHVEVMVRESDRRGQVDGERVETRDNRLALTEVDAEPTEQVSLSTLPPASNSFPPIDSRMRLATVTALVRLVSLEIKRNSSPPHRTR